MIIYGVRESNVDFTRPLIFQDLVPLREITKEKWTGEIIKEVLLELQIELGKIKYAVGDHGNDIRKALQLANIKHVHDLTHKIALILEKKYEKYPEYIEVTKNMTDMRLKYSFTKFAHIIPPKQRKISRYQNIKIISDWCEKSLKYIQSFQDIDSEIYEKLKWLINYEKFIKELSGVNKTINKIEKILKHNGLSKRTRKKCSIILNNLESETGIYLKNQIIRYLNGTKKIIPKTKAILISSDIIESAFGKYKNYVSLNQMAGITNLILCLAAFTSTLSEEGIKEALEKTTIHEVNEWTKKFVGKTLLQKRKEILCFNE